MFSGTWFGVIPAGGNTNVTITFSPAAVSNYSGNLTVISDATSGVTAKVMSGVGVPTSSVAVEWTAGQYDDNNPTNGPFTLGYRFRVETDIEVTELGVYDQGGDGLHTNHTVAIWSVGGGAPIVSATVPSGTDGILDGHFRYVPVAPITLLKNTEYVIGASDYAGGLESGASAAQGFYASPYVTWLAARHAWTPTGGLSFPSTEGESHGLAHFGANFRLVLPSQPIPGTPVTITKSSQIGVGARTSIGLSPDNTKLYAAIWEDQNESRVLEYSLPDLSLLQTLTFGGYHTHGDVVVSADGCRIFTPNYYPDTVSQVNLCEGNARTDLSTTQSWPADIDITPDRSKIVVTVGCDGRGYDMDNDGIAIYDISGTNFASLAFVALDDEPIGNAGHKLAFSADGQFVYVPTKQRKSATPMLYEVSLVPPYQVTRSMEIPSGDLRGVACSGNAVFVSDFTGSKLWIVNRTSWTKTLHVLDAAPGTIAMHPDGQHLFVLLPTAQKGLVLDATSLDVMGAFDGLAVNPHDIEFNNVGDTLYISHSSGFIYVFKVQPRALLAVGDASGNVSLVNLQSGTIVQSTNLNATAIARLDVIDVDGDSIPEILVTHKDTTDKPTYCLTLPQLSTKWQTDRSNSFAMLGGELAGGPRIWAGDFARDGVLKLLIPSDSGGQYVNRIFRAADGTFESTVPEGLNWYPIPFLDPVDFHWKLATEIAPNASTHYLCAYDLTAGAFLWTNTTVNTWPLGAVNSSLVDGGPRLWGGWYGRTLYVTDRNGVNQWHKSFGGSYEAVGTYAGDLLGNGAMCFWSAGQQVRMSK